MTPMSRTVAFQGEPGAFSHAACLEFLPDAEPRPLPSFEAVVEAVRSGACTLALLPVENSLAGPVEPVLELLAGVGLQAVRRHDHVIRMAPIGTPGERLQAVGRHDHVIRMALIGAPGASVADLRVVASHPVALRQCTAIIAELGLTSEPAFDTAGAARLLAETPDRSRAVLASEAAAALHGLPVLRTGVENHSGASITRFLLLSA